MKTIKNYTSTVPASQSIQYIEFMLIDAGASRIMKDYEQGKPSSMSFTIMEGTMPVPIKLPAKMDEVKKILRNLYPKKSQKLIDEQASRTAWKLIHDWVEMQMTMRQLRQIEMLEIFLPYVYDFNKNESMIQKIRSGGFLQLPQGNNS